MLYQLIYKHMKFEATIKLFSEVRKSELNRKDSEVFYNNYNIEQKEDYFKYLSSLYDSFLSEFHANYFEINSVLILYLLDDLQKIRKEIEDPNHPHLHFKIVSEGHIERLEGYNDKLKEEYPKLKKMVLYQIKLIDNLEKYLLEKLKFQEEQKIKEKLSPDRKPGDKIKFKLSKSEVAMLFLILESNDMILFKNKQNMISYIQSNFMYYDRTKESFGDITELDSDISKIKGGLYKKPATLKSNLINKLSLPKFKLADGSYI